MPCIRASEREASAEHLFQGIVERIARAVKVLSELQLTSEV
jgi:hypothetical protein